MADRIDQVGLVHRVEMQVGDAAIDQVEHLLGADGGGDQPARRRVVLQPLEAVGQPLRHARPRPAGKAGGLLEVLHRDDAGQDRDVDAAGTDLVEIAEIDVVIEEELGDRPGRAGIDLLLQRVDVGIERGRFRMLLRIGRDGDLELADPADAFDQVGGLVIALRMRLIGRAEPAGRIAPQRHDMAHACRPIGSDDLVDLGAGGGDAGQMRRRLQTGLVDHALDGVVGALAGRAAGAIGHGDERRTERLQPAHAVPQIDLHLLVLRRKELEGDARTARAVAAGAESVHHATSRSN